MAALSLPVCPDTECCLSCEQLSLISALGLWILSWLSSSPALLSLSYRSVMIRPKSACKTVRISCNTSLLRPPPARVSDSVDLGWCLKICISKFPGNNWGYWLKNHSLRTTGPGYLCLCNSFIQQMYTVGLQCVLGFWSCSHEDSLCPWGAHSLVGETSEEIIKYFHGLFPSALLTYWQIKFHLFRGVLELSGGSDGKEYTCNVRDLGSIPGKIPWSREWLPIPVFLPGKSFG